MDMIRVWRNIDISEIDKHIVIMDDLHGFCPGCKNTGIKYDSLKQCSSCGREFRYAATREKTDSRNASLIIKKIQANAPDLIIIDYSDYKHLTDRNKAASLFGKPEE